MDAIWQKIKADIGSRALISTLIVVTVAAASLLLTLALATLMNMGAPYDRAFDELNAAHLWLYFDRDKVRARDVERIEELPGVVGSTGVQYGVDTQARIHDTRALVGLRAVSESMPAVNRLSIIGGRYLEAGRRETMASKDLNYTYQLQVGERIEIADEEGREVELPVVGLAYNAMWDTYRLTQPPYVYVSQDTLQALFPDRSAWSWSLGLRLADPESVDEMLAQIEAVLRTDAVASYTDWRDVRESAIFAAELNLIFLGTFGLFAILATILVVASSISSIVLSQFRQIGILKAVGFAQGQILLLYLGQYLVLGLIGCVLGLAVGIAISPLPLRNVAASLSTPFRPAFSWGLVALVVVIVLGVVVIATLGAAVRGARANIIRAIAVGAEPPRKRRFDWSWLASRLGLSMVLTLGMNDVFAKPLRSLMIEINLTMGVIGIVFGLMLNETLQAYKSDPSLVGIVYDATVARNLTSDRKTRYILDHAPGVDAFYGEYVIEAKTANEQTFQIKAVDGDLGAFPFRISEGRFFQPGTNEAVAGRGLLDWLGLEIGDEIAVTFEERPERLLTFRIVGQYPEPAQAGQRLMVSLPALTQVLRHAEPAIYYLKFSPNCNVAQLKAYLEPDSEADLSLTVISNFVPDEVRYLQIAILILGAILIGIALINVFNVSLLAVQEKVRMVGVLKTVGMTPFQVMLMVMTTAGFLGLIATGLGIPIGWLFTRVMLNVLSRSYGFDPVQATLNLLYITLLLPGIVLLSMFGSFIPGRWATRVSIVNVLRGE